MPLISDDCYDKHYVNDFDKDLFNQFHDSLISLADKIDAKNLERYTIIILLSDTIFFLSFVRYYFILRLISY